MNELTLPPELFDGDPTIAVHFHAFIKEYAIMKDLDEKLKTQKAYVEGLGLDLQNAIEATGAADSWELEKGIKCSLNEKHYWNYRKTDRDEFLDWIDEMGLEDTISVNDKTLAGAIRNRVMPSMKDEDGNVIEDENIAAEKLPEFITHHANKKVSVHHTALKKYRERYL